MSDARKKTTGRKSAGKKATTRKAVKKKAVRRTTARKKSATKRPLTLIRREGSASAPAEAADRPRPQLRLVKGGKAAPSQREERLKEALEEDLAELPQAAVARIPGARSFQQTDVATGKQLVLFQMARARTSILAALQGLQPGSAEQLLGKKKWSVRQMVLHLCYWDQEMTRVIEPAIAGVLPEWSSASRKDYDKINAAAVEALSHLNWDDAMRTLHSARQELLAAIEDLPDEPSEMWSETHALGRLLSSIAPHDLHHADVVKRWRAKEGM